MIAYTKTPTFISEAIQRASFNTISFVENAVAWVIRNNHYTNMVSQLSALDDHLLEDIGLERRDINAVAKKLAR